MSRLRPITCVAVGLLLGCMVVLQQAVLPNRASMAAICLVLLLVLIGLYWLAAKAGWRVAAWLSWSFTAGMLLTALHGQAWLDQRLPDNAGVDKAWDDVWVQGQIASLPMVDSARAQFDFVVEACPQQTAKYDHHYCRDYVLNRHLRLSWYDAPPLPFDRDLQLQVRLRAPHGFANPGGLDFEQWLLQEGIHATGYVRNAVEINQSPHWSADWSWLQLRHYLRAKMQHILQDREYAGILLALAIGDRSGIPAEQWQVVQRTGVAHLLAISGLHVGGLALVILLVSKHLWRLSAGLCRWLPAPRAAVIFATLAAVGYAGLAGFTLPTQRALLMWLVVAACLWLRRRPAPSHGLCVALIVVLVLDPLAPLSAGFWLSFGVVAALLFGLGNRGRLRSTIEDFTADNVNVKNSSSHNASQSLRWGQWRRRATQRLHDYLVLGWRVPLIAAAASLPKTKLWFGQVAWLTPLVNVVLVPVFSFVIVPAVLLSLPFVLIGGWGETIASALLLGAHHLIGILWQSLEMISNWPFAVSAGAETTTTMLEVLMIGLAVVGVVVLLSPLSLSVRSLGVLLCLPLLLPSNAKLNRGELQVAVLDVGQGLAVVLQTKNYVVVYDTGPSFRSGSTAAQHTLAPYLRHSGVDQIDRLIVSHGDNDHSGGVQVLQEAFDIGEVLVGEPERLPPGIATKSCQAGQKWVMDGVTFTIMHPHDPAAWQGNNASCVLHIKSKHYALLLTGDIERDGELDMLQRVTPENLAADFLLLPHHGSNSSSTYRLIRTVKPRVAIAAAAKDNRWGFPKEAVVERWQQAGAAVVTTGEQGALMVSPTGQLSGWRQRQRRFWQAKPPPLSQVEPATLVVDD